MEVLSRQGGVVGGMLLRVTKAGRWARCQRCMDLWASFSRVSKSGASYLLLTGPGPASSVAERRTGQFHGSWTLQPRTRQQH